MPITNFPGGVSSFGIVQAGNGLIPTSSGQYFWVASNGMGSVEQYDTTIANALSRCVAGRGDVIIVEPGYTETISTASGLTIDKSGVTIVGLGNGALRPTLTLSATAATILISAANVTLKNVIITSSVDELVTCVSVTAANVTLDTVDYVDGTSVQTIQFLLTNASADDLTVQNCKHIHASAPATAGTWISLIGADRARILNNQFYITQQNGATSCVIGSSSTAPTNILIDNNIIMQTGGTTIASAILLLANTTGMVTNNSIASTATTLAGVNAIANCYAAQNFVLNTVNKSGILDPVADS